MDLDWLVFWLAVVNAVLVLVQAARVGFAQTRGLLAAALLVLGTGALAHFLAPDTAGWLTGSVWLVFFVQPILLTRRYGQTLLRQDYRAARRLVLLLRWVYPLGNLRFAIPLLGALEQAQAGGVDDAIAALRQLEADPRADAASRMLLRAQRARLTGRWEELLAEGEAAPADARIRALGETGRLSALVEAVATQRRARRRPSAFAKLFVLAFCGRRDGVALLLDTELWALPPPAKTFWLATAGLAAGEAEALSELTALGAASAHADLRRSVAQRLDRPLADPRGLLDAGQWREIEALENDLRADAPFARPQRLRSAPVSLALAVLNLLVFAVEIAGGGSQNLETLYDLGGLWAPAILEGGEWWRLGAALFLHYGPIHLIVNMAALIVIGPRVEAMLGAWRYALVYLGAGVASMGGVLALTAVGWIARDLTVGASGAIFGILGGHLVLLGRGWWRRSKLAARTTQDWLLVILMQGIIDVITPQVSFTGHLGGLIAGIALTLAVLPAEPRR